MRPVAMAAVISLSAWTASSSCPQGRLRRHFSQLKDASDLNHLAPQSPVSPCFDEVSELAPRIAVPPPRRLGRVVAFAVRPVQAFRFQHRRGAAADGSRIGC